MKFKLLIGLTLAALLLAACGKQAAPSPTATPIPPTATPVPPTDTPIPSPTHAAAPVTAGEISNFKVEQDGNLLTISFEFSGKSSDYNAFHVFIDADQAATTGYKVSGMGAEFMIENVSLFAYKGDGSSWQWEQVTVTNLEYQPGENIALWKISRADVNLTQAKAADFVAQLVNTNWDAVGTTQKLTVEFK